MNRIKECRKKRDLIQTDLASRLGLTQSGLSLWETGKVDPGQEGWLKLSEILNVSVDYLMGSEITTKQETSSSSLSLTEDDSVKEEAIKIYDTLTDSAKKQALDFIRFLANKEVK